MSTPSPEHSPLCSLIDELLRPYTQSEFPLTKESEKDLLIALSQVLRQIKFWTHELDSDNDNDTMEKPADNGQFPVGSKLHYEEHHCLTKIIGDLMFLLAAESRYVQHLAGNIIVIISEFVVAMGSNWGELMHLLCLCLELAICNAYSSSFEPSTTNEIDLGCDSSSSITALKPRLKNANLSSLAGIVRVLRNILKHLKVESDGHLLKVYFGSIGSCLSNVPWDLLDSILIGQNGDVLRSSSVDALLYSNVAQPEPRITFKGNLIQFFCSLVEQSGFVEAAGGSQHKHSVIFEIHSVLPKLLAWCLDEQGDCTCIPQYFRHKILILMSRLSVQIHLECSILVSWLHLIHKHFQDLLLQPIIQLESDKDDCLEGSPFLVNVFDDGKQIFSSRHLQRLAVLFFLKSSLSLISLRERSDESGKEGSSELYEWLQGHLPVDIFADHNLYFERCVSFALSFLQLYMHEDDILFEVLLQLFCVPFFPERQVCKGRTFQEVNDNMLFLVSDVFNPISLFHLFLAEILYDHQVLLDYLISKDTGASSAEYLLRCLRIVCDSWKFFVEFSVGGEVTNQSSCKKRKVSGGVTDLKGKVSSASMEGDGIFLSPQNDCKRGHPYGCKHYRTERPPFDDAKDCLLSLKISLENLHRKNLFPYDPQVLLRRLTRFQGLCLDLKKI
ncbi:unnamed protein product [Ilex paraguariensis]|uniref:Protein Lines C-terminal domain-containing protein n=1 Tax=Ilex paraguariensis TaxID=185542 RepID=A0ABC8TAF2_9AQUA